MEGMEHERTEHKKVEMASNKILEVQELTINISGKNVVESVSFDLSSGEVLGIVGESGAGKTMTALSILRLTIPTAKIEGRIIFEGKNLLELTEKEMRKIRGNRISLVLQNPHSAFNPVFKVGYQVAEPLMIHRSMKKKEAIGLVEKTFHEVGITEPSLRIKSYPHELSGGMKQRAVISISLLSQASLIIADEPTTALDPTIESQILKLLRNVVDVREASMIFISHDISVVSWISDKLAVMYGGWIVEYGKTYDILRSPLHPYTKALLESIPKKDGKPKPIPGSPLDINWSGCKFAKRCPIAEKRCFNEVPPKEQKNQRDIRCFLV